MTRSKSAIKLESLHKKIHKKQQWIKYCEDNRDTNPEYFDKMARIAEFELQVLRLRLAALSE